MVKRIVFLFLAVFFWQIAVSQQFILDKPLKAGPLILFPDLNNPKVYYYLPDKARLATDASGMPQFSFLRYVENATSTNSEETFPEGVGGGIVHAVVSLAVTEDQLSEARTELRRLVPEAVIQGPVIYKSGKFGIVSSFAEENGEFTKRLVGTGSAPILDGQKAAISIRLTKLGAKVLWESFKTATPDISFSFEMELEGFRMPVRANLEANYEQIYKHEMFNVGVQLNTGGGSGSSSGSGNSGGNSGTGAGSSSGAGSASGAGGNSASGSNRPAGGGGGGGVLLGADLKWAFDDLRRTGAIKLEQVGNDANLEQLLQTAYAKLAETIFDRVSGDGGNGGGGGFNPAQLSQLTNGLGANQSNQQTNSALFSAFFKYEMKKERKSGVFRLDFNKWTTDKVIMRFDENIGNLSRYQKNPAVFRQVNLDDPLYKQREVIASIDGYNASDFGQYINFVTVHLRKTHEKGAITDQEVRIDRTNFNQQGNLFRMVYGWKEDNDRQDWMNYEYEVLWSLFGDVTIAQKFTPSTFSSINLAPPFQKREVEFQADPDLLAASGVRLVTVKVYYKVADKEFAKQVNLNPAKNQLSQKVEYLSPASSLAYEYEVSWVLTGGKKVDSGRKAGSESFLFVDELPN